MTVTHLDPGGSATGGTELLVSVAGAVTAQTSVNNGQAYAYKFDTGAGPTRAEAFTPTNVLAAAGRRISKYCMVPALPSADTDVLPVGIVPSASTTLALGVYIGSDGKLRMYTNGVTTICGAAGATVLSANTWYRITLSYAIVTTTNWSAKVYINGVLEMTRTNADATLSSAAPVRTYMVVRTGAGTNYFMYISDLHIDDTTDQSDPAAGTGNGELHVGRRAVTTVSSGAWDTTTGTGDLTERPVNTANRIGELATGPATVDYNVEGVAAGDANLTGATIVGRGVYAWFTLSSLTGTPLGKLRMDGTAIGTVMDPATANTYELKLVMDTSTTYPSTVGVSSSGLAADTLVAELGAIVAYIPAAAATGKAPPPFQRPWRRLQRKVIA